ncbi:ABC-type enterochelin transport system, permease component [Klebsiella pneumoniae]|uniref:ABC-type enterochelin transport system, permease component n=1 Tax=Klebsiella pneumoniae TaxID=573 RepID=A0A378A0S8_KLEPN|nr:ABC-type enterochelin transport system, permease component [Klebsiella pneumoniae]
MLFALAFCFAASLIFVAIVRRIRFKNTILVPVIGLMYGGVLSAIAEFYAYRHNILQSMQGWLLGDFSKIVQGNYEIIYLILPIVALAYLYAHRFTVLGMGEGMATSLGLNYPATVALGLMLVPSPCPPRSSPSGPFPSSGWSSPIWSRCITATTWAALCPWWRWAAHRCCWPATSLGACSSIRSRCPSA